LSVELNVDPVLFHRISAAFSDPSHVNTAVELSITATPNDDIYGLVIQLVRLVAPASLIEE
jgi:hypothetical protein